MQSYGRISSEAYGIWFPETKKDYEDADFYRRFIKDGGQPALEIGCGNGRLLIPYLSEGLSVEGLDLSPYMIEICKKRALAKGLNVTLYQQAMQNMDIGKRYQTIFIPFESFMLIHKDHEILNALKCFYTHLHTNGHLLIPLFIPTEKDVLTSAPKHNQWRLRREGLREDGATVKCWEKADFDLKRQEENAEYRYEVIKDGKIIDQEKEQLKIRWHTQDQFTSLLKKIGFRTIQCVRGYSHHPAQPSDDEFTFIATK